MMAPAREAKQARLLTTTLCEICSCTCGVVNGVLTTCVVTMSSGHGATLLWPSTHFRRVGVWLCVHRVQLYEGQHAPCKSGSYDPTGVAPSGVCSNICPPHLPYSKPGSTTFSDCLTTNANLFVVSTALNRIVAINADTDDYQLIKEGGEVDNPYDNEFINETELLVSIRLKSRVDRFNTDGQFMGTFAFVGSPIGILYLAEFNLVVIASATSGKEVYFFDVNDYLGEPLRETNAVGVLTMSAVNADYPQYLSRGENPDEILITTFDNKVVRMCVPTTACTTASRVMPKNGGVDIQGIATLHSKGTFLVADRKYGDQGKIFECSLTWVSPPSTSSIARSRERIKGRREQ